MRATGHSESVEMYLKQLAMLGGADRPVAVALLAERLGVTPVAVNELLRRLMREGLATHEPYRGFGLTAAGREAAWDVIRRERVWERFLVDRLGIDATRATALACQLEHATAPEVIEALDAFLGFPATCPQGQPIPRSARDAVVGSGVPLVDVEAGRSVILVAFDDEEPEILAYLRDAGLTIGSRVTIQAVAPRRTTFTLAHAGGRIVIGRELAAAIRTEPADGDDPVPAAIRTEAAGGARDAAAEPAADGAHDAAAEPAVIAGAPA